MRTQRWRLAPDPSARREACFVTQEASCPSTFKESFKRCTIPECSACPDAFGLELRPAEIAQLAAQLQKCHTNSMLTLRHGHDSVGLGCAWIAYVEGNPR